MKANPDFIYVVGCPRSGTYLLAILLNRHFGVILPLETLFIPLFKRYAFLWGDLKQYDPRKRLLDAIYAFLEIWYKVGHDNMDFDAAVPYSLLATRDRSEEILADSDSYSSLVENLFRCFARIHGAERWGDKTVIFNPVPLDLLSRSTPRLKVIHIVRDGRDVYLSWRRTWFGPKNIPEAASLWLKHVNGKQRWGTQNPGNYMEIRYEDLLEDENGTLDAISGFLGIDRVPQSAQSYGNGIAVAMSGPGTHELLFKPIDKSNRDKWKTRMSAHDRALFEFIAGDTLRRLGFEIGTGPFDWPQRWAFRAQIAASAIQTLVSPNNAKRAIRSFMPVALWMGSLVGIDLTKIVCRVYSPPLKGTPES